MNLRALFRDVVLRWGQKRQLKHWKIELHLNTHEPAYQKLFASVDGFALSHQARVDHDAFEYTYGEIDFISFIALLFLVKPDKHTIFYDLGSGIGTAVLACAMVYPVKKSVGIECFSTLHDTAVRQKQRLEQHPDYCHRETLIDLIHANFLHVPMNDATLIFINSTAYFGETWEKLNQQLEAMPHLTTVITLSKPLCCSGFVTTQTTRINVSWGEVQAYIHQRINVLTS